MTGSVVSEDSPDTPMILVTCEDQGHVVITLTRPSVIRV